MLFIKPIDNRSDFVETYELTNLRTYIKEFGERGQRVGNGPQRNSIYKICILYILFL